MKNIGNLLKIFKKNPQSEFIKRKEGMMQTNHKGLKSATKTFFN